MKELPTRPDTWTYNLSFPSPSPSINTSILLSIFSGYPSDHLFTSHRRVKPRIRTQTIHPHPVDASAVLQIFIDPPSTPPEISRTQYRVSGTQYPSKHPSNKHIQLPIQCPASNAVTYTDSPPTHVHSRTAPDDRCPKATVRHPAAQVGDPGRHSGAVDKLREFRGEPTQMILDSKCEKVDSCRPGGIRGWKLYTTKGREPRRMLHCQNEKPLRSVNTTR